MEKVNLNQDKKINGKETPNKASIIKCSSTGFENLSYHQVFDNQNSDGRG